MFSAAGNGNMAELELVAEYAPDRFNVVSRSGSTPLHCAAHYDQEAAVSFLLSAGANVNQTDNSGETPLSYCGSTTVAAQHRMEAPIARNPRVRQLLFDAGGH